MLKVLGENYYVDLDKIDDYVQIKTKKNITSGDTEGTAISIIKYETIKLMLEIIKVRRNINQDLKNIIPFEKIEFDQYLPQCQVIKKAT